MAVRAWARSRTAVFGLVVTTARVIYELTVRWNCVGSARHRGHAYSGGYWLGVSTAERPRPPPGSGTRPSHPTAPPAPAGAPHHQPFFRPSLSPPPPPPPSPFLVLRTDALGGRRGTPAPPLPNSTPRPQAARACCHRRRGALANGAAPGGAPLLAISRKEAARVRAGGGWWRPRKHVAYESWGPVACGSWGYALAAAAKRPSRPPPRSCGQWRQASTPPPPSGDVLC